MFTVQSYTFSTIKQSETHIFSMIHNAETLTFSIISYKKAAETCVSDGSEFIVISASGYAFFSFCRIEDVRFPYSSSANFHACTWRMPSRSGSVRSSSDTTTFSKLSAMASSAEYSRSTVASSASR